MKLYNKNKSGKIIEWDIEVDNDKYRTITGQVGGTLITSNWTTCKGKNIGRSNETTSNQQALKEVEAKIKKKKEEGYVEDPNLLKDKDGSKQEIVMLAEKYKDFIDTISFDEILYVQPKLDGIRCKGKNTVLLSRKDKPFVSTPHILKELQKFHLGESIPLDGELYNHDFKDDFNAIVSIVKKAKPTEKDLQLSEKFMQYHIYDIQAPGVFSTRWKHIQYLFQNFNFKYLKMVPTFAIKKDQVDEYHDKFVALGYEGIIIRRDAEYEYFRSKNLLKLKHWMDEEFEIIEIEEGIGNRSGMMGGIILKTKDGKIFTSNAKGTYDYYKELLINKNKYIGKMATLKYQNLTPDGIPRFGVVIAIRDYE